jgi:hypothetical protein
MEGCALRETPKSGIFCLCVQTNALEHNAFIQAETKLFFKIR